MKDVNFESLLKFYKIQPTQIQHNLFRNVLNDLILVMREKNIMPQVGLITGKENLKTYQFTSSDPSNVE